MNNWKPIETAPKDGTEILVTGGGREADLFFDDNDKYNLAHVRYNTVYKHSWAVCNTVYYDVEIINPTHWMELPELPTSLKDKKIINPCPFCGQEDSMLDGEPISDNVKIGEMTEELKKQLVTGKWIKYNV